MQYGGMRTTPVHGLLLRPRGRRAQDGNSRNAEQVDFRIRHWRRVKRKAREDSALSYRSPEFSMRWQGCDAITPYLADPPCCRSIAVSARTERKKRSQERSVANMIATRH
jgi:hypothetical protein